MDLKGIAYLRRKLALKACRVRLRYRYYEMKNSVQNLGAIMPAELARFATILGWCAKGVDSLADRLSFREFREDNFLMNEIFAQNNPDVLFDSAMLSALIASCSFIYISQDEEGQPRMQVIDGGNATGIMDPITGMLTEGYVVLSRDDMGSPLMEAYLSPGRTTIYQQGKEQYSVSNPAPYALLVPIVYRPDAVREFGHSRISRSCMSITKAALRTLQRMDVSAEFYSFPQKYVTGLSSDAEQMDKARATISTFLQFDKDADGDVPKLGQFAQQSMSPYTEQMRTLAALFAGETGLTLDDLGFVTDNPSSAEAIKAAHENLRLAAHKAKKTFGSGFLNAGYLAACVRDNQPYKRSQIYLTKPIWEPVFEPDAAMLAAIGDAAGKINLAVPGYFGAENLRDLTGIAANTTSQ